MYSIKNLKLFSFKSMFAYNSQEASSTKKKNHNTAFYIGYSGTSFCQGSNFPVSCNKLRSILKLFLEF